MCRNHSHITTELTGHLEVGETRLVELRVIHPLEVDLPYGEKWIRPSGSTLFLPVSMSEPLPALAHRQMVVCYTPSFFMGDSGTITMRVALPTPTPVGQPGTMSSDDTAPLPQMERTSDNDLPF